ELYAGGGRVAAVPERLALAGGVVQRGGPERRGAPVRGAGGGPGGARAEPGEWLVGRRPGRLTEGAVRVAARPGGQRLQHLPVLERPPRRGELPLGRRLGAVPVLPGRRGPAGPGDPQRRRAGDGAGGLKGSPVIAPARPRRLPT